MRTLCSTIAAITLLSALAGCASTPAPLARDIGAPPAYLATVPNPPARTGQNAAVHAEELGASVDKANIIIACADAEWRATRMTLLAGERPVDAAEPGKCPALELVGTKKAVAPKPKPAAKATVKKS